MRIGLLIAAASLSLGVVITAALPEVFGQAEADVDKQSRLEDLLEQRRDVLASAVELAMQQYLNGDCSFEFVLTTRQHLHEAELEAATTREDRVAALERHLEAAEASVAVAEQMFQAGRVTSVDVLLARAASMRVEIRLLREGDLREAKDN